MSKQRDKPFSWLVVNYDCNRNKIVHENILEYREDFIKKLKKECETREEFSEKLRREMQYYYWGKCEAEVLISRRNNQIFIRPWCGCINPKEVEVDVTDDTDFDWIAFYNYIKEKRWINDDGFIKIDIYSQLMFVWEDFLSYVINYKHRYQREDYSKKFAKR